MKLLYASAITALLVSLASGCPTGINKGTPTSSPSPLVLSTGVQEAYSRASGFDSALNAVAYVPGSLGILYAAGYGMDSSGQKHWIVRKSLDYGTTWSGVDEYQLFAGTDKPSEASAIAADSSGRVYVTGYALDATSVKHWITRSSMDGGASWSTDDYAYASGYDSYGAAIAIHPSGAIIESGAGAWLNNSAPSNTTKSVGLVRRSLDHGATWSVTLISGIVYSHPNEPNIAFPDLTIDPTGNVAVPMYMDTFTITVTTWDNGCAYFSPDQGASWAKGITINDHHLASSTNPTLETSITSLGGLLYITATEWITGSVHGYVYVSSNQGGIWNPLDDYTFNGTSYYPNQIRSSPAGQLWVTGYGDDGTSFTAITRASSDDGKTWSNFENYQFVAGKNSAGTTIGFYPNGQVYWGGYGTDASGVKRWLFRRIQ
ncbi:MAG: sialidase family protein [Bdellovibrionota bacterium]